MSRVTTISSLALMAMLLFAEVASACPQCAQREGGADFSSLLMLFGMISAPLVVGGSVFLILRRMRQRELSADINTGGQL